MRSIFRSAVFWGLLVAGIVAWPFSGHGAGEEVPERLGGLSYNDAFDHTTVIIDVLVRDDDGNPVRGLTREQFRLFEDGAEVPISHFAAYSEAPLEDRGMLPEAGSTEVVSEDDDTDVDMEHPIYVILFIDNQNLRLSDRNRILRSLQAFVSDGLDGRVQIMVVTHNKEIEVRQSFTNNVPAVVDALRAIRSTETGVDDRLKEHDGVQNEIRRAMKNQHLSPSSQRQERSKLFTNIRNYIDQETMIIEGTLSALREVFMVLAGIDGRKYFVYVSNGLPMAPGADLLHQFAGTNKQSDTRGQTFKHNKRRQYNAVAASANALGITIHAIDATGSARATSKFGDSDSRRSASAAIIARENRQTPLKLLAGKTGGLAVVNTSDFAASLDRIRSALLTFYSIGHDISSRGSDTLHRIEVTLDTGQELYYSRTSVRKSLQSEVQDKVNSGLFFDVDHNPLGLEITAGQQVRATEDRWQLPLVISLPVKSLAMVREGNEYVGRAVHFIAMRALGGGNTEMQRQTHTFRLKVEEYEQFKDESFPIYIQLLVESGEYRIAVGVLDEVTHQASIKKLQTKSPGTR